MHIRQDIPEVQGSIAFQHFVMANWQHAVYSLLWVAAFAFFAVIYPKVIHKYGPETASKRGWIIFNAGLILIGAFSAHGQQIKIDAIVIPHILTTPVFIILTIALAKVVVGVIQIPLEQGILPNSVNTLVREKSQKTYVDALNYNDALAHVLNRMVGERLREAVIVLRYKCQTDAQFMNELTTFMTTAYDEQLMAFNLESILLMEPPEKLQDRALLPSTIDFETFTQISSAAQSMTARHWETGVAEPFVFWGQPFVFVLCSTSSLTVPSRIVENYLSAWNTLCELPYVKDKRLASIRANRMGVTSQEKATQFLANES